MPSKKSPAVSLLLIAVLPYFFLQSNGMMAQAQKRDSVAREIREALRLETQYFYQRDIANWEGQWSHGPFVMKCYLRDGKYTEQLGWPLIRRSAEDYMKAHPEPERPPTDVPEYKMEVFEKSAFVTYLQFDPKQGRKREIRLLVKENGKWRIGYMSTNYLME